MGDEFEYDSNGNMTLRDVNGEVFEFAYDQDNRVKAVDQTTGETRYYVGK